ncbi:MAG: polysaccharide pyruvyl transferase family protein [Verrucomicrobiales bacterium]
MNQDQSEKESASSKILLVGNGTHQNRGCEAIVRGTIKTLEKAFKCRPSITSGVMASPVTIDRQKDLDRDIGVPSFSVSDVASRGSLKWWGTQFNKRLGTNFSPHLSDLAPHINESRAALQIGGDNYSLDYGRPAKFLAMDNYFRARNIPVFIWGASVGPFDHEPKYEKEIISHLRSLAGIFVRETASLDYLHRLGLEENIHLTADPAFLMDAKHPKTYKLEGESVQPGTIGLNISPLVGRFRNTSKGSFKIDHWSKEAEDFITTVAERIPHPILLIPHVGASTKSDCDFHFLSDLFEKLKHKYPEQISLAPFGLNAPETKWLISQCCVFAGARTHATIAALSSSVPTLSLSYSMKAKGINQDLFTHQRYCLPIRTLTPEELADRLEDLISDHTQIKETLDANIPGLRKRAFGAGSILKDLLANN